LNPQEAAYEPLKAAEGRREFPCGKGAKIIAAKGWCLVVEGLDHVPGTLVVRLDPNRVDDLIDALQQAKRHQKGQNPEEKKAA
jgi:hypothetical protein